MTIGAYYFEGWTGRNSSADDPKEPWARNAPAMLRRRMVEEFPQREPVWGWRDDSPEIMEKQITLAADHGLGFFAFCWYWHDNGGPINAKAIEEDPKHTGLELFLKAKNNDRMKFCLLVANHQGFEIKGTERWKQAADCWMRYLKHPRCVTVGGKPLLIIFNPDGGDKEGFAYLQEAARKAGLPGVAIAACGAGEPAMGYTHKTLYNVIPGYFGGSGGAQVFGAGRGERSGVGRQPRTALHAGGHRRLGQARLGESDGHRQGRRMVLPGPHAGAVRGPSAQCDDVDGQAPRSNHRRAHRPDLRVERTRRRRVYHPDEGRSGWQVFEGAPVGGDVGESPWRSNRRERDAPLTSQNGQMETPVQDKSARHNRQLRLQRKRWAARAVMACVATIAAVSAIGAETKRATEQEKKMTVGAYYYDGWAGRSQFADDPKEPWARNAPAMLTRRMVEEFPQREPVWGWRDDSVEIMERQIDLAADHGLSFFAFCWYWRDNGGAINKQAIIKDPVNTSLGLYLKARNNRRLKFCLMVANHEGYEIKGKEYWKQAADYWMRYLKHPQCVTVGGKPLLIIFNPAGADEDGIEYLQVAARKAGLPGVAVAGCGSGALKACCTLRTHYNVGPG